MGTRDAGNSARAPAAFGKNGRAARRALRLLAALVVALACTPASGQQPGKLTPAQRDARAREYFTDTVLKTQQGRAVRFYSDAMRGKVVLINFMYTSCGDACPLITAKLVQAKNDLGETFGREVRFLSLSIDPLHDRPEDLAKFARKFDAEHADWLFLTGEKANVDKVLKKLGAYTETVEDHSTGIIIGSPSQGRWKKVRPDAPAKVIAEELRHLVAGEIEARKTASAHGAPLRP
jgi:cytochrome oxidase Cu insertion factor (SCO1/SenC/PrrC family)